MIGQRGLQWMFDTLIEGGNFPRFCILTGAKGSGKKTMVKWIAEKLGVTLYALPDIKVDTIRQMIDISYKAMKPTLYAIYDADNMSIQAKNTLLKITEEPPNNAYFIMTLEDESMTLDTIKSRASIYAMNNYSNKEIEEYANRQYHPKDEELDIIIGLCEYPGDVDMLWESKPLEFYDYVVKVVDNIADVEGANAFKIADRLALKQEVEGYDVKLFLREFMAICMNRLSENPLIYATGIAITSKYISQLGISGVSKQMLIDAWILEIRNHWMR